MRAISRVTGASKNTIVKLLGDAGEAFSDYQDRTLRNLTCKQVQVDEIWAFVYAKAKNVVSAKAAPADAGDCWTWMAIDSDTKLIPSFYMGKRDAAAAHHFIGDLALRLANRVQLTSDGRKPYLEAVDSAFGADIDHAMLVKHYGDPIGPVGRYSPGACLGAMGGQPAMSRFPTTSGAFASLGAVGTRAMAPTRHRWPAIAAGEGRGTSVGP